MIRPLLLAVALMLLPWQRASAAGADAEIAALIAMLGDSGCRFERNDKWYDAAEARAHLQRKYAWLRKRGLATTSEQFIARAASESSVTGRPYHVQCPGRARQTSADWFGRQLQRLRATPE